MARQIWALLSELKTLGLSHPAVQRMQIRSEEVTLTKGYLRMRMVLQSQSEIEAFVYLVEEGGSVRLKDYSLHWQHADGTLVQRWDTAPHHPELVGFPHHTHTAKGQVEPTAALDWKGFMVLLERAVSERNVAV